MDVADKACHTSPHTVTTMLPTTTPAWRKPATTTTDNPTTPTPSRLIKEDGNTMARDTPANDAVCHVDIVDKACHTSLTQKVADKANYVTLIPPTTLTTAWCTPHLPMKLPFPCTHRSRLISHWPHTHKSDAHTLHLYRLMTTPLLVVFTTQLPVGRYAIPGGSDIPGGY